MRCLARDRYCGTVGQEVELLREVQLLEMKHSVLGQVSELSDGNMTIDFFVFCLGLA
jgi:hypothetical protein